MSTGQEEEGKELVRDNGCGKAVALSTRQEVEDRETQWTWPGSGPVNKAGRRSQGDTMDIAGQINLLVADLDVVEPSVHPVDKELHTGHVHHKVRQVPSQPNI